MKYNLKQTIEKHESGESLKYIFFWGHRPSKDGTITASCFSQWWMLDFIVDGITYKSAEHWMMAKKALLFNDEAYFEKIIQSEKPGAAKSYGRKVRNFDPVIWDEHKNEIVIEGNHHKFSQHQELKNYLLQTQDRILVEASPVDAIWGIGMAKNHKSILEPNTWKGQNLLGFALMEVRDRLS